MAFFVTSKPEITCIYPRGKDRRMEERWRELKKEPRKQKQKL
jgi:hypothetical protein